MFAALDPDARDSSTDAFPDGVFIAEKDLLRHKFDLRDRWHWQARILTIASCGLTRGASQKRSLQSDTDIR